MQNNDNVLKIDIFSIFIKMDLRSNAWIYKVSDLAVFDYICPIQHLRPKGLSSLTLYVHTTLNNYFAACDG